MSALLNRAARSPRAALSATAVAVLTAVLVVVLLGWAVTSRAAPLLRVDRSVADALYVGDHPAGWLDGLLQVATAPGLSVVRWVVYLPVLAWLVVRRRWWTAGWVATAVVLVTPLTAGLKDAVGRVRPQFTGGGGTYDSLSFPSGHSSGVATLVTVGLVLAWPLLGRPARRGWLAAGLALAVLVGLTRMWLGVHWLSDVVAGEALGLAWTLLVALAFGGLPGGRAALNGADRRADAATGVEGGPVTVDSRVLLDPDDGSLGPLLRLADDRLTPGQGYGQHAHRDIDVVAVVLAGSLTHRWDRGAVLGAGDVGVLRAGDGLRHDEVAGDAGAHVLQTYLRATGAGGPAGHEVRTRPAGWVELDRPDARLWIGTVAAGESADPPAGLRVLVRDGEVTAGPAEGPVAGPATVCVWQLDTARPTWGD